MNKDAINRVIQILQHIMEDTSVPRNIRRAAEESKDILSKDDDEPTVRASTVISILDETSNDPNIPIHARTLVWNVLSELESVRD
jgi:uncharacterized protein (UPF0147 family)